MLHPLVGSEFVFSFKAIFFLLPISTLSIPLLPIVLQPRISSYNSAAKWRAVKPKDKCPVLECAHVPGVAMATLFTEFAFYAKPPHALSFLALYRRVKYIKLLANGA